MYQRWGSREGLRQIHLDSGKFLPFSISPQKVLEAVRPLLLEANIYASRMGLELSAMDAAHVSLVTVSL